MTDEQEILSDNQYPDVAPDTLGELKEIKRIPGMKTIAPNINWGQDYKDWPIEKRLHYAERLASTMNHAADVLQQERNSLLDRVATQEKQLEHAMKTYMAQGDTMHRELGASDAEKQKLYQQVVDLQRALKEKEKRIKELEGD